MPVKLFRIKKLGGMMTKSLKNLFANIKREKLMALTNITVMTITFLILGVFISLVFLTQTAIKHLEEQAQVTIFFKDDFSEQNILSMKQKVESDKRVAAVNYVSKNDALKIFMEINKSEPILLESISANILPASLEIKAKNISTLKNLAEEYSKTDGVEEIKYFKDVIDKFSYMTKIIYIAGSSLLAVFLIVSFSVILITIRLTIQSKGTELEILKLVGATDSYVKTPLIYQGVFFGLISAVISSSFLFLLFFILQFSGVLSPTAPSFLVFPLLLTVILTLAGFALGYLGSITAVKKYLNY